MRKYSAGQTMPNGAAGSGASAGGAGGPPMAIAGSLLSLTPTHPPVAFGGSGASSGRGAMGPSVGAAYAPKTPLATVKSEGSPFRPGPSLTGMSSPLPAGLGSMGGHGGSHGAHAHGGGPPLVLPPSCDPLAPTRQYVWIIFGASGALGRHLSRTALSRGDLVMACSRSIESSVPPVDPEWRDRCMVATCDVRERRTVKAVVDQCVHRWNRIDVVVDCVGSGIIGPCEEQEQHDVRNQFETNVLGLFHIVQTTLPYMRMRSRGRYIIFSSIAGMLGIPGLGPFSATKWATEGMIESLAYELEPLGCAATLVYPGVLGQDGADKPSPPWRHFVIQPSSAVYRGTPAEHARRMILWLDARQSTSGRKIADIVFEVAHCGNPPLRVLLGSEAVESMQDKLRQAVEEVEDWKFMFTGEDDK
ncbi:uncharacterized protein V1510DRAFT_412446 [Dipodascopsis tothii]|uniref:uncharacterized protein n=1 Tax=Dipodascopsis tothii TaxID=44089 RepID=UPI0034CD108A